MKLKVKLKLKQKLKPDNYSYKMILAGMHKIFVRSLVKQALVPSVMTKTGYPSPCHGHELP